MTSNTAAYLDSAGAPLRIGPAPTPTPSADEVVVRVSAAAINPVDPAMQSSGLFVKTYPHVLGNDVAGTIEAVGSGVTHVTPGDRVLAHMVSLITAETRHGGFQRLAVAKAAVVTKVPDGVSDVEAAVVPLGLSTAALGLYRDGGLGLRDPRAVKEAGEEGEGGTLLVWGAASSVGSSAVQLAVAGGYRVIATCSHANFGFVEEIGHGKVVCVDYKEEGVVERLVRALKEEEKFVGAFDAIGTAETMKQVTAVVDGLGGGTVATVLPPPEGLPQTVTVKQSTYRLPSLARVSKKNVTGALISVC